MRQQRRQLATSRERAPSLTTRVGARAVGLLLLTAAATLTLAPPRPACAQRNAYQAEGEVERLLKDARAYYENLELESADEALSRAIGLGKRWGIRNRMMADTYILRGILVQVRDQNAQGAIADFIEALKIDERAKLDPMISNPSLERLFRRAERQLQDSPRPPDRRDERPPPDRRDEPPPPDPIRHRAPRVAKGGEVLPVAVEIKGELNQRLYRVYLFYRSARAEQVQRLEMLPKGQDAFKAEIPGRFVAGRSLSYYINVEDRRGQVIASVRSPRDPIEVPVEGDTLGDLDKIPSGEGLGEGGGWGDEDDKAARKYVSIGVSVGTGGGFITDLATPVNTKSTNISPGFAVTPFHTLLELDFWATEWLGLGAFARLQIVEWAHLEGGRLKFRVVDNKGHQLFLRAGGGVGRVRHLIDFGDVLDTTLEGPYFYTLGLRYLYNFSKYAGFAVTPDFLHMIGDSPSQQIDLNLGVIFSF
ncbi:hypothetical protein KKF91_01465 [Myxococcota bacterium]|nr:hypothetical protein [Myxococcota bacterium]MBU1429205.1 hypothetical protein [Myxococcota bacterium]MBU1898511.1 hypothetical protein [Myxococcota bacterium]